MHRELRKPLIVMTPKSLLRHKRCVSTMKDFTKKNSFHRVLEDDAYHTESNLLTSARDKKISKVVICSGKIYFDLIESREKTKNNKVVFIRIEQIYPFPLKTLANLVKRYSNAEFIWCQEEPKNMGSWFFVDRNIEDVLIKIKSKFSRPIYVGRAEAASPATGSLLSLIHI